MLIVHKVFFKRCHGNISRIRDLSDVLGLPHLYKVFIKEFIYLQYISGSFAPLSTFSWGGANAATPRYPTVELSVWGFGG